MITVVFFTSTKDVNVFVRFVCQSVYLFVTVIMSNQNVVRKF